jgi:hypothetical protein
VFHLHDHIPDPRAVVPPIAVIGDVARLRVARSLNAFSHCNDSQQGSGVPLLVPPTWNKAEHHRTIERVWRHAARELATARNIIVIGYSLPETDAFFRYLYALGTVSDTRIERFWVVDPDETNEVRDRFRALLGPTALSRFEMFPLKFDHVVHEGFIGNEKVARFRGFLSSVRERNRRGGGNHDRGHLRAQVHRAAQRRRGAEVRHAPDRTWAPVRRA